MPEDLRREFDRLKNQIKTPLWKFSGLVLILLLIISGVIISNQHNQNELLYITEPAVGDIYEYEVDAKEYSTLKVKSISNDSVHVSMNEYIIDRKSRIYKIDLVQNYSKLTSGISKVDLIKMYNEKVIFGVNRND